MIRHVFLLLLALLLAACGAAGSEPDLAAVPALQATMPSVAPSEHGAIVRVDTIYEDGYIDSDFSGVLASPAATASPAPTASATPTPTTSLTPPPTNTPRPTASSTPVPTPTRESTPLPTSTPFPTAVPKSCELQAAKGINVRSGPSTAFGTVGAWSLGSYRIFDEFRYNAGGYMWGHSSQSPAGWSVVYDEADMTSGAWWAYGTNTSETCRDVPGWPPHVRPPEPVVAEFWPGFHTLAGTGTGDLLFPQYVGKFRLIKCLDNGFAFCQQAKAANPDVITIYRTYRYDCPPPWAYTSPDAWWSTIAPYLPAGATFYEIMNECDPDLAMADLWAEWNISMARIVARERGAALLGYSAGPGHPDINYWKSMVTYLRWTLGPEGIAPNGFRHGVALHSSAFAPDNIPLPAGSWINHPWIADRETVMCETMRTTYDFSCEGVFIINSELGWADGYQGSKDLFTCEQQGQMYRETIRRKKETGLVDGFALWNVGQIGMWSSVHPCLPWILN